MRAPRRFLLGLGLALAWPLAARAGGLSVDGPVDLDRLLEVTRLREAATYRLVYSYTYRQTTTEERLDDDGHVIDRRVTSYVVVPTPQGIERHLLSKDGREPSPAEVRKQERRNEAVQRRWERMREQAERTARRQADRARPAATSPARATAAPPPATGARQAPTGAPTPRRPAPQATAGRPSPGGQATPSHDVPSRPSGPIPEPPTAAPVPPLAPAGPAVMPPVARIVPPVSPPATLAPLPECDLADPAATARPPVPGSATRSRTKGMTTSERVRRSRERASDYSLFELLNLTEHEYAGACTWEGRAMHVVRFSPPTGFDALNPVERVVSAMSGTILIDGGDMEVARAVGATVAPITWGAGMVKLKSARVLLEYARIRGELWLPRKDVFEFQTRVVFDKDSTRVTHEFDDFRKAQVETEVEYGGPVDPGASGH